MVGGKQDRDCNSIMNVMKEENVCSYYVPLSHLDQIFHLCNNCQSSSTGMTQKKLDFNKIDSFHGTGGFNVTLFPEWDSLFLELAKQDPEPWDGTTQS